PDALITRRYSLQLFSFKRVTDSGGRHPRRLPVPPRRLPPQFPAARTWQNSSGVICTIFMSPEEPLNVSPRLGKLCVITNTSKSLSPLTNLPLAAEP
ncbi:MAG: hypothetical protein QXP31_10975, partial [Pyrobaculum sp.]